MKKFVSISLAMAMTATMFFGGCGSKPAGESSTPANASVEGAENSVKVAVVLNNLGDMGFNDEAFSGVKMAEEELGIEYDYVECPVASDAETQVRMFADTEEYDLIMVIGADKKDGIEAAAADYPDQKFSLVDSPVNEMDNLHGTGSIDAEQTFLSGVIAGLVTVDDRMPLSNPENVIGFVGGMDSPASRGGAAGFIAGAKYVNPGVEILYTIVGNYKDPGKAKEIALTGYGRGADIMSHNCGASGMGVFNAAAELDKYVIGSSLATVDVDRSLCTSIKRTDLAVFQEIEAIQNGTWAPGSTRKGIKDGICDYNIDGLNTKLPDDLLVKVEEIKQMVKDGKITMPSDPDEIDEWLKTNQYGK